MSDLHSATVIADVDLLDTVEFPLRKAGAAGLLKGTFAKLKTYLKTTTKMTDFSDVDITTPPSDGQALIWNAASSKFKPGSAGSVSSSPTAGITYATPAVRSSSSALFNASTVTLALPAGTIVGDAVFVFAEHGYDFATIPAGWTLLAHGNSGWTFGITIAKIMTAGDIATGSVTVTWGGAYNGTIAAVAVGGVASISDTTVYDSPGSTSIASTPVTGLGGASAGDLFIGFFGTRGAMNVTASNFTVLQTQNGANGSGMLGQYDATHFTAIGMSETATFPAGNSGVYVSVLALRGKPTNGPNALFVPNPPTAALMSTQILAAGAALTATAGPRSFSIVRTDTGAASAEKMAFQGKAVPAGSNWTVTAILRPPATGQNKYYRAGLAIIDQATGKTMSLQFNPQGGTPALTVTYYTNLTTFNADLFNESSARPEFLIARISYDGTNYTFKVSFDYGTSWVTLATAAKATYFTATHIGLAAESYNTITANMHSVTCLYWDDPDFAAPTPL